MKPARRPTDSFREQWTNNAPAAPAGLHRPLALSPRHPLTPSPRHPAGSAIVTVVALLGVLSLLGFLVFSVASQEHESAKYFTGTEEAKTRTFELNPDPFFDFGLRQLILGAARNEYNSAFWGGRKSLLPTMFGRDINPYSGQGVNLGWDTTNNVPFVDMDYDEADDGTPALMRINDSAAAQIVGNDLNVFFNAAPFLSNVDPFYEPDADYTSPDQNSGFLSYRALTPNGAGGTVDVRIASMSRPQLLRNFPVGAPVLPANWYTDPATKNRVLRPHQEHLAVAADGTVTMTKRFVSVLYPEVGITPFPFGTVLRHGHWSGDGNTYDLDADPDGDGKKEGVYVDLHYPIQTTADGLSKFVPMFSFTVISADGLFDINTHGNFEGDLSDMTTGNFGGNQFISTSNQGLSPSEINMEWALHALPTDLTALKPHRDFFGGNPPTATNLSNMELWFLLAGRAEFDLAGTAVLELFEGRHGELGRLDAGIAAAFRDAANFSWPGMTGFDDNANLNESGPFPGPGFIYPASFHPLDFRGPGSYVLAGSNGKNRLFAPVGGPFVGRHKWPAYSNYVSNPLLGYAQTNATLGNLLMPGIIPGLLFDEASETHIEPDEARQQTADQIFGPGENAALHLSPNDLTSTGVTGRAVQLMPYNLQTSPRNYFIRGQLTANSWDLKSYGKPYYGTGGAPDKFRRWEWSADSDSDGKLEFPPQFATWDVDTNMDNIIDADETTPAPSALDPFRPVVRALLTVEEGEQAVNRLQRRLSVNGILDFINNRFVFRPLTPHPAGLGNTPVPLSGQEYQARRDRQNMARDIYVLLYTLGGGNDARDYSVVKLGYDPMAPSPAPSVGYSNNDLKTMAQFAVNLVDALDPDDTITMFVYDKNLGDGWNPINPTTSMIDDYPYDDMEADLPIPTDPARGLVYGVEAQRLAFNEVLAFISKRVETAGIGEDHEATKHHDKFHSIFTYIELENVSPRPVSFAKEGWQIRVKPIQGPERRLTFKAGAPDVLTGVNSRYTVGTTDAKQFPMETLAVLDSNFHVDPLFKPGDPAPNFDLTNLIVPQGGLQLDLIAAGIGSYRVNESSTTAADGTMVSGTPTADPPGGKLLEITASDTDKDIFEDKLGEGGDINGTTIRVTFELYRRVNLNRQQAIATDVAQSQDNRWVKVDEIQNVPFRVFGLKKAELSALGATEIRDRLIGDGIGDKVTIGMEQVYGLKSKERWQPLDPPTLPSEMDPQKKHPKDGELVVGVVAPDVRAYQIHSIGRENLAFTTTPFIKYPLWHPHFDRDFASVTELFNLPLFGPNRLTKELGEIVPPPGLISVPAQLVGRRTAGNVFLNPDAGATDDLDNRWCRLLEYLEVPSRLHRHLDNPWYTVEAGALGMNPPGFYRVPGKPNLNMLRHPSVLAGILDDPNVFSFNPSGWDYNNPATMIGQYLPDASGEAARDWYYEFIRSRDGVDPITGLPLPGLPTSRPFRDLGFNARGRTSIDDTLLRSLPADATEPSKRGLFEIGNNLQHTAVSYNPGPDLQPGIAGVDDNGNATIDDASELGWPGTDDSLTVDYTMRHRLLQKVLNNSTTRSNVFLVFVQVDFFEAKEVSGVVRIGAKRADSPGYRSFFVIDRSKALELVTQQDLPGAAGTGSFSFSQNFDFRPLVLHRQRIK